MSNGQKSDFQDGCRRHLEFQKNAIFGYVTVIGFNICYSVPIFDAVYRISSKSGDFSLRYGDLTIFKMAAVRHVGF